MRIRGLLIAVVVLAALAGGVYWSNKVKKAEEGKPAADAPPKVLSIPQDQFQQIEIHKGGADALTLRKDDSGKWQMVSPKQLPVDQDAAGGLYPHATGAEVKEGIPVELAHGGPVGALDVVGVDLELGLGRDVGVAGEEQVAVGLVGVRLLRLLADVDLPPEDAPGRAV